MRLLTSLVCLASLGAAAPFTGADADVLLVPETAEQRESTLSAVLVRGLWGAELGAFGKVDEASRPGPMDFAYCDRTLYVLDPVNARVQLFNLQENRRSQIDIGTRTADFLCVDQAGDVTVLDAFVQRQIKAFSKSGELLVQARIPASIGLPSAIFTDGQRLWLEERHNRVYELGLSAARPAAVARVAQSLRGRPLGLGRGTVHVRKDGTDQVALRTAAADAEATPVVVRFPRPVAAIVGLESDASGTVYVVAACVLDAAREQWQTNLVVAAVSPHGRLAGTWCLPDQYVTDHYRKVCVTRGGYIIQMQTDEQEVRFVRWTLPTHVGERSAP
ncbi:MAG: hypothetical protein KKB50_09840 [Planctomycetes bacterium]|nr:hypothetical protein [Planctomycetota bacterium]